MPFEAIPVPEEGRASAADPPPLGVVFIVHQIGSQADGGVTSISELVARAPGLAKHVVTNLETAATERWRASADVSVWPMVETHYGRDDRRLGRRLKQALSRAANNLRTWRMVRRTRARVVHINDHRAFWNSAFGAKAAGAKVVFNVRDTIREGARTAVWRFYLSVSDLFLVLSQDMVDQWRAALRPASDHARNRDKFRYIYSIVDHEKYYPTTDSQRVALRGELGMDVVRPALIYVGRFDEKKAQLEFIRQAGPLLKASRPDALVYMVGDFHPEEDPYAAKCRDAVQSLSLTDSIRFMGYSARIGDWYRAGDVTVLASRREGLPRCVIEGVACGAPLVAFAVCSAREVLEGHGCGRVAEIGDYSGLVAHCLEVLGDPALAAGFRQRGPDAARRLFAAEANARDYRRCVDELAAS